jgi:hypothetical protein
VSTIDHYLAELRRALPAGSRRRVLAEVEDHLRESAAVHGEDEALARFGSARDLAASLAGTAAVRETLRAAALLLLALVPAALAAYPLPQNLLPPWGAAPADRWPQGPFPTGVAWKQDAILLLLLVAGALGTGGITTSAFRRVRLALPLLAGGLVSLVSLAVVGTVLALQWERALPAAPGPIWIAAYALVQTLALAGAAAFAGRATLAHVAATR